MPVKGLLTNATSLLVQRELGRATSSLSDVFERLSSGQRINHASDDSAGLSIATKLSAAARLYTAASRNLQDGMSALTIADSALSSLTDIVTRIAELAEQAANGPLGSSQRESLDAEAQALRKEFNRVIATTTFNDTNLLDGSISQLSLQAGIDASVNSQINVARNVAYTRYVGDGSMTQGAQLSNGFQTEFVLSADFNGDGKMDLISAGSTSGSLVLALGNGDGTFLANRTVDTMNRLTGVTGDFNNDGKADIATGVNFIGTDIRVSLGDGAGGFTTSVVSTTTVNSAEMIAGDLNNDGNQDLVFFDGFGAGQNVHVLLGNGNGSFRADTTFSAGASISTGELADLNNDGYSDLIYSLSGTIVYRLGQGNGSFGSAVTLGSPLGSDSTSDVSVGDFNGDGDVDLLASRSSSFGIVALFGNGNGTFASAVTVMTGLASANRNRTAVGDLNGDGIDDFAADFTSGMVMVLSNGDGTFRAPLSVASAHTNNRKPILTDLTGDGVLDIATATFAGNTVDVFIANSTLSATLAPLSLRSRSQALSALSAMNTALQTLNTLRSRVGADMSRVSIGLSNVQAARELHEAAFGRIMDADVADDAARMVSLKIRQQAAASLLAQANQEPGLVLKLLS